MSCIGVEGFISAIGDRLKLLFPQYCVYDDEIPQNAYEDCFHISVIDIKQKRVIGIRWYRKYDFNIRFLPSECSINHFYRWEEVMLSAFEAITIGEVSFHVKDVDVGKTDGIWYFTFAVSFYFLKNKAIDFMGDLTQLRGVYND